jgi:hypothetical protein
VRNLGLIVALLEEQVQHLLLDLLELLHGGLHDDALFNRQVEGLARLAVEFLEVVAVPFLLLVFVDGVERADLEHLARHQHILDGFGGHAQKLGDFLRSGRASQACAEFVGDAIDFAVQLLQPRRLFDDFALVAQVVLDLPDNQVRRVGGELDALFGLEQVQRVQQPQIALLDEVFDRFA